MFGSLLELIAVAYFSPKTSNTILFWLAFVVIRPLGAALADILTKQIPDGGLHLTRLWSSLVIAAFLIQCILSSSQPSEQTSGG